MLSVLKNTWTLYVSMLLIVTGLGFQNTILPIYGEKSGFDSGILSYVLSTYYVGFFLGVQFVPKLLLKVGYIRVFAMLATLVSSMIIVFGLLVHPLVWILIRILMGFCFSGLYLITESWINIGIKNESRGQSLSLYLIFIYLGTTAGQYFAGSLDSVAITPFVWMSLVLSLSFIPVLLTARQQPCIEFITPISVQALYKISPMGVFGIICTGVGNALSFAIGGVYIVNLGAESYQVAYFLMSASLGGLVAMYPVGKLSDMFDRRKIIVALCCISLGGLGLLSMQREVNFVIYIAFAIINFGLGPLYSVCLAQTNDWIDDEQRLSVASRMGLLFGLGSVVGGLFTSYAVSVFGIDAFIYVQGIVYVSLLVFALSRIIARKQQVEQQQAHFIPYPSRGNVMGLDVYDDEVFETDSSNTSDDNDTTKDI